MVLVDITPRWETAGVERILAFMQAHPDGFASYARGGGANRRCTCRIARERKSEDQLRPLLREGADGRLRWHWDPALLGGVVSESERYQPRLHGRCRERSGACAAAVRRRAAMWCRATTSTSS